MTDGSMIERVATAITVQGLVEENDALDVARCAIEAMRLPDKAMIDAGATAAEDAMDRDYDSDSEGNRYPYDSLRSDAPATIWQAMIDATLL